MPAFGQPPVTTGAKTYYVTLNRAAGTYDICQAMGPGEVLITQYAIYCNATGNLLTSAKIHTNDATQQELMSAAEGAVANLLGGKLVKAGNMPLVLHNGAKIQITQVGNGDAGSLVVVLNMAFSGAGIN